MRVKDDQPIDSQAAKRKNEERRTEINSQKSNIDDHEKYIDDTKKADEDMEPHQVYQDHQIYNQSLDEKKDPLAK